jgi:hypothetical protein
LHSLPCWSEVFSLAPWLLLDLTGLNWGQMEIYRRYRVDRQRNLGLDVLYTQLEMHNLHCFFFSLDFLRPFSLQFFKTLLKTSFLRLPLPHVCSQLIFSLIGLKVFSPRLALSHCFCSLKAWELQTCKESQLQPAYA